MERRRLMDDNTLAAVVMVCSFVFVAWMFHNERG